jgi:hypothetical protein
VAHVADERGVFHRDQAVDAHDARLTKQTPNAAFSADYSSPLAYRLSPALTFDL